MISVEAQKRMVDDITVPEVRSALDSLLDAARETEVDRKYKLTAVALHNFYNNILSETPTVETERNILKGKLIETGVLYFGPMHDSDSTPLSRAEYLHVLGTAGFSTEHLVFLNETQLELFHTYVRETGLV